VLVACNDIHLVHKKLFLITLDYSWLAKMHKIIFLLTLCSCALSEKLTFFLYLETKCPGL
jgi:hypothetical protein